MKTLCKAKVLLTKGKAILSLVAWLLAVSLLVTFLFCGDAILLILAALLILSRVRISAASAEVLRRSMTNPMKPLFFALNMLLPVAEIQYFAQGCEEIAVRPFWLRIPIHSNIAVAETVTKASPYIATAEDHDGAITVETPVGKVTVTINQERQELYMFLLSGECNIEKDIPLPGRWKRECFSQEYADDYSVEFEIAYCPFATIEELVGLIIYQVNRLVYAAGKGE